VAGILLQTVFGEVHEVDIVVAMTAARPGTDPFTEAKLIAGLAGFLSKE
jgi:hypothetical protein